MAGECPAFKHVGRMSEGVVKLRAMLELRRHDPDSEQFKPDAYVFGNEVGERLKNYQKAWSTRMAVRTTCRTCTLRTARSSRAHSAPTLR